MFKRQGSYYFECGNPASAVEHSKAAFERQPEMAGLKEKLAKCHVHTGDTAAAAHLLDEVIAENPMNLAAYDALARIRLRQNELPAALTSMRQALVVAPIDPRPVPYTHLTLPTNREV